MTRGGARARSGPAPDPMALKRERDKETWTRLPKEGCALDVPDFPIEFGQLNDEERVAWERLWRSPQAIVWHRDGMIDIVCSYLRALMSATKRNPGPGVLTALRMYSAELLLSTSALRRERFYIQGGIEDQIFNADMDQPLAPAMQDARRTGTEDASVVRGRFTVVKPQDDDDDDSDPRVSDE